MAEYTENFEIVLYYKRRAVVKPSEPNYTELQILNLDLSTDELLDLYSDLKNKYKEDMKKYEKIKDNSVLNDHVRIPEDEHFIEEVRKFEKNGFFIEWSKTSKKLIDNTFLKFIKNVS
jgi:hypothetical protein